ncbi:uncharacterized protein LOC142055104 [Phalacrocorax aristotelis]|uniref:uncharacterized protein LOC142055104 n=1 Tax=Phalacrocorax aristotelis TaxID=126867 RepID=UPI003F4B088F
MALSCKDMKGAEAKRGSTNPSAVEASYQEDTSQCQCDDSQHKEEFSEEEEEALLRRPQCWVTFPLTRPAQRAAPRREARRCCTAGASHPPGGRKILRAYPLLPHSVSSDRGGSPGTSPGPSASLTGAVTRRRPRRSSGGIPLRTPLWSRQRAPGVRGWAAGPGAGRRRGPLSPRGPGSATRGWGSEARRPLRLGAAEAGRDSGAGAAAGRHCPASVAPAGSRDPPPISGSLGGPPRRARRSAGSLGRGCPGGAERDAAVALGKNCYVERHSIAFDLCISEREVPDISALQQHQSSSSSTASHNRTVW